MYNWKFNYLDQTGRLQSITETLRTTLQEDARTWFTKEGREKYNLNEKCKLIKCWITF